MKTEWKWGDPPTTHKGMNRRVQNFVAALKERPGKWAQYRPGHPHSATTGQYLKKAYGLEVTTRRRPDLKFDIYARYMEEEV